MKMRGAYHKYTVIKNETGEEKTRCWVLCLDDKYVKEALTKWAEDVRSVNPRLADDIMADVNDPNNFQHDSQAEEIEEGR